MRVSKTLPAIACLLALVNAQSSCSTSLKPANSVQPIAASGYSWRLVATGLNYPRSIQFDTSGNLLVVEADAGSITALTFEEPSEGCVSVSKNTTVISNQGLNHGIALSDDGNLLYASSPSYAWSWTYDPATMSVSDQRLLVTNMSTDDHTTRTLLLSQMAPGLMVITRGSTSNIDLEAATLSSGHSEIKAFNITNVTSEGYNFDTSGLRLGWGLRNDVGVAEHPVTGGIYSVENSADQITRDGVDVHENNPGEELNFLGYLDGTPYADQGGNYGYPYCFAAWNVSELPENSNLSVGSQFAIDGPGLSSSQVQTDVFCSEQVAPRLTFQAHMAPIDIIFNNTGTEAWISFHGSWDRVEPIGYMVGVVAFENGEPVEPSTSTTAVTGIFSNVNDSVCPQNCFRPTGLTIDKKGRLFVASDMTGEIYMITATGASSNLAPTTGIVVAVVLFSFLQLL